MKNVSEIKDCYGCGVCSAACSCRLIDLKYDADGFLTPFIRNIDKCTECGLCLSVCSFINDAVLTTPIHSYAAWSKDDLTRKRSTSGGVSFELAKLLLSEGATFCGARYNIEAQRVEHYFATNESELFPSIGSKYLQSYTVDAFQSIDRNKKTLVVGTPCQIASLRRYIQKFRCEDNFLLVDFFCHGVPSILMWRKYLSENTIDLGVIKSISWRNKEKGWRKGYCIKIDGSESSKESWNGKDDFYTLFLGDACLNKACYDSCKYKYNRSSADIRIGDYWSSQYKDNKEGVCAAIAFSEYGNDALNRCNLHLEEFSFNQVAKGQMKMWVQRPWYYRAAMNRIHQDQSSLKTFCFFIRILDRVFIHYKRIKNRIKL